MKRLKFVVIALGIVASIGYLITSAIQATGVPYKHVDELTDVPSTEAAISVKVTGKVKQGTLDYDPHAPRINFRVAGPDGESIAVTYEGIKPDAMVEGGHVILEGTFQPSEGKLSARTLLAKCPSRYKSEYKGNSSKASSPPKAN